MAHNVTRLHGALFLIFFGPLILSGCQNPEPADIVKGYVNPAALDTGLPVIKIDTRDNQQITSKEIYIEADVEITDPVNADNNLQAETEIRGRGNTTWGYLKKPYRLKFFDKQSLFGLEKAKSWVLLANYLDPTLIMTSIAFELGRIFGLPYSNHYNHVEVILNGVYEGSYVLTEQVQAGKGRVDIDEDEGFLVELDTYYDEEPKFKTNRYELPVMIKSPEYSENSSAPEYDFVKKAINDLEELLYADSFPNNNYRDLIDINAFVDFLIINEIVANGELIHPKSTYMYKDKGSAKIGMGPLWDFDWAFGYTDDRNIYFIDPEKRNQIHPFFKRFFDDPAFRELYKERWNSHYTEVAGMESFIGNMATRLDKSQKANYAVWKWYTRVNYTSEITKMKAYWHTRVAYLNTEINALNLP
ncbi:MAG: CotH kinase family protein [Treponema sp.]|jgi:hypothetical protein|nr:CotH kinase family protein [Treponema sp.]